MEVGSSIRVAAVGYTEELDCCVLLDLSYKGEDLLVACHWASERGVLLLVAGYCLQLKRNGVINIPYESWVNDSLRDNLVHRTSLAKNEVATIILRGFEELIFASSAGLFSPALSHLLHHFEL